MDPSQDVQGMPAYLLVRFRAEYVQKCRNSLISQTSITNNCRGRVLGIATHVEVVEGRWPRDKGVAVMHFETMREALLWLQSAPDAKQPDWIHSGVEVAVLPIRTAPVSKPWVVLHSLHIRDGRESMLAEYESSVAREKVRAAGGSALVAFTGYKAKPKGPWDLEHVRIDQWDAKDDFSKWYHSDSNAVTRSLAGKMTMQADVVIFELQPLVTESCYLQPGKTDRGIIC